MINKCLGGEIVDKIDALFVLTRELGLNGDTKNAPCVIYLMLVSDKQYSYLIFQSPNLLRR